MNKTKEDRMLTFTSDAHHYAVQRGKTLYLDYITLTGCCIPYQPAPTVRFGLPHDPKRYHKEIINDLQVFIPHKMPDLPLEIHLATFMGLKRLVVEGWSHT